MHIPFFSFKFVQYFFLMKKFIAIHLLFIILFSFGTKLLCSIDFFKSQYSIALQKTSVPLSKEDQSPYEESENEELSETDSENNLSHRLALSCLLFFQDYFHLYFEFVGAKYLLTHSQHYHVNCTVPLYIHFRLLRI